MGTPLLVTPKQYPPREERASDWSPSQKRDLRYQQPRMCLEKLRIEDHVTALQISGKGTLLRRAIDVDCDLVERAKTLMVVECQQPGSKL